MTQQTPKGQAAPTNGCFSRAPFKPDTLVKDGYEEVNGTLVPKFVRVPFRMSNHCNYTSTVQGRNDSRCQGCAHRQPDSAIAAAA